MGREVMRTLTSTSERNICTISRTSVSVHHKRRRMRDEKLDGWRDEKLIRRGCEHTPTHLRW
jgi:hypothetical protein